MDSLTDPQVRAAAAQVRDFSLDVGIGGLPLPCDERCSRHDLTGLAIAATRHAAFYPRLLDGMLSAKAFDGDNLSALRAIYRQRTGPDGLAVDVHRARSAKPESAAVLCSGQSDRIPQNPEQWSLGLHVHTVDLSIYIQRYHGSRLSQVEVTIATILLQTGDRDQKYG